MNKYKDDKKKFNKAKQASSNFSLTANKAHQLF